MIDYIQKKRELTRAIELLTAEVADLIKRKKELERVNVELDRKSYNKLMELKDISDKIVLLRAAVDENIALARSRSPILEPPGLERAVVDDPVAK